jgi:hypothetical protein
LLSSVFPELPGNAAEESETPRNKTFSGRQGKLEEQKPEKISHGNSYPEY